MQVVQRGEGTQAIKYAPVLCFQMLCHFLFDCVRVSDVNASLAVGKTFPGFFTAGENIIYLNTQRHGQLIKNLQIRVSASVFPFGNCLKGDLQLIRQLLLRHFQFFSLF